MPDRVGLGEYLLGCALLAAVLAAAAWVAVVVVRRRLPWLTGAPRLLAGAVVMTAAVIAVHLLPAMLGVLSRWSVLITALLAAAAATAVPRTSAAAHHEPPPEDRGAPEGPLSWLLVAAGAAAVGGWLLVATRTQATQGITHIDQLNVYLPDMARLIQRGSIWHNDQFVPLLANGNYPQNGVLLQLATVLPWRQDAFVRFAPYPFAALTVVALYALARQLAAPRTTAWLVGIAFLAMPHMAYLVVQGLADGVVFFGLATGVLFLLRFARTRMTAELVVAGLALGLGFGTKWYGAPAAVIVVGLWLLSRLLGERAWRRPAADSAIVAGAVAAAGGVWLVRNLAVTSSPTFPAAVDPLGITIFPAPFNELTARVGFSIAHYATDRAVVTDYIVPAWWDAWGPFVPLVLVAAIAAVVAGRRRPEVMLLGAGTAALLVAYVVTPNGAWGPEGAPQLVGPNARYGLPAVVLAAALAAWLAGRDQRLRLAFEAALLIAVVAGLAKAPPLGIDTADVVLASAALLVAAAGVAALRGRARRPSRPLALAGAALLVLVALAGGRALQDRQEERRYAAHDAPSRFIRTYAPQGHRVGIAGTEVVTDTSPIYPAFGPRLRNDVAYVGPFVDDLLRRYDDARDFQAALRRGRFDLLVVYRPAAPGAVAQEEAWATQAGFRRLAQDQRLTLLGRP
ncbi:MAG TPA: glycosyltransferase family 39 protein [Solirubrobacteraceae bacterium]|jgi:hypothetical protein